MAVYSGLHIQTQGLIARKKFGVGYLGFAVNLSIIIFMHLSYFNMNGFILRFEPGNLLRSLMHPPP